MLRRGTLSDPSDGPAQGEHFEAIVAMGNVVVEHIVSGHSSTPASFLQTHDEWVVVLSGAALLDVDGERCRLGPRDWVLLPAGIPHTVLETTEGTTWLAVHVHNQGPADPPASGSR